VTRVIERAAPYVAQLAAGRDQLPGRGIAWVAALREGAMARFAQDGFPTLRTEAWKYTNLDRLSRAVFGPQGAPGHIGRDALTPVLFADGAAHRLVLVDGRLAPALSDIGNLPGGVRLSALSAMLDEDDDALAPHLGRIAGLDGAPLAALNAALMTDGAVLLIGKGARMDKPVHVVHVATEAAAGAAHHLRNLIVLEDGGEATLVETRIGLGSTAAWTNSVTEIAAGQGARLRHCVLAEESAAAFATARTAVRLDRDASYEGLVTTVAGGTVRHEVRVELAGERAEARLDGLTLGRGRQHTDCWTEIVHAAPRTTSRQLFKSALDGRSHAAFQGRVAVREGAIGTDAHQLNRNLLLSREARADSKPELEILADDVKCSHGATVGDLDRDALFYLRSRGIALADARALLVEAFIAEVVERIAVPEIRTWLDARIARWLAASSAERKAA
jgi:Fe-S cluster assembly protein SufD